VTGAWTLFAGKIDSLSYAAPDLPRPSAGAFFCERRCAPPSCEGDGFVFAGACDARSFAAALPAAFRWNKALVELYKRLIARGKAHHAALTACARKVLIYANNVVQRGTLWTDRKAVT
jgi:hypothetical protein